MSKLDKLIQQLRKEYSNGSLEDLRDPELVIKTLDEFSAMIGNDSIKDLVASQTKHLLKMRKSSGKSPMINTIIYGPPGVGKTKFGSKLASIWYGLGYLKQPKSDQTIELIEQKKSNEQLILLALIFYCLIIIFPLLKATYVSLGFYLSLLLLGVLLFGAWWYIQKSNIDIYTQIRELISTTDEPVAQNDPDDGIFKIVSREDFVDKYVGWSDKKTKALLTANLGRVLFIDEAYSLLLGPGDQYGIEAMSTLNRFLSEHPDEIIVIFAGYRDKLEVIFREQPGLLSRCMWHFEIAGYSPDQLFEIFIGQLKEDGWSLNSPSRVRQLFHDMADAFPNFGRDCERLCNYTLIEHSDDQKEDLDDTIISTDQVRRGIGLLRSNNTLKSAPKDLGFGDLIRSRFG